MSLQEVILCATTPLTPGHGAIALHDIQSGSTLATFKQTSAQKNCSAVIPTRDGQGGFMLTAQSDKSILNVYNFQKVWCVPSLVSNFSAHSCPFAVPSGPACAENCPAGETVMYRCGPARRLLCRWNLAGKDISLGGAFLILLCVIAC